MAEVSYRFARVNGTGRVWVWGDGLVPYELPPVCYTSEQDPMEFGWGPLDPGGLVLHSAKALIRHITGSPGAASRYYQLLANEVLAKLQHRLDEVSKEALLNWLIARLLRDAGWAVKLPKDQ